MTECRQVGCIFITSLLILLKNALSLSILARYSKNGVLTGTIWNVIDPNSISKLIDPIDVILLILNIKLADPAIFLLSWIVISSCYNTLSWFILLFDQVEALKSISNPLNLVSFYQESADELKT